MRHLKRQVSGETLSSHVDAVDVFKTEIDEFLQEYTKDQVFNADETGLNFQIMPKNLF